MSRAPVTLYTMHDHWLVCPTHVLWKFRNRPCDSPQCIRCSLINGIPPQWWRYTGHLARSLEHVDVILAPSRFTADTLREAGFDRPCRVLNSFSALTAADAGANYRSARPLFAYAGRLESSKGLEQLLAAFRERSAYELLVAGHGSLDRRLREEYADCAHIRFLGTLPHGRMAALYRDAVAVVSPTWGPESFHLVTVEAMACGTPVIGRRAGGSVEAIELTGGGLIYDRPEELLPLVDRLARDPDLRRQLSARATDGYRRHYSEERWMEQYFELIAELSARRTSDSRESTQLY